MNPSSDSLRGLIVTGTDTGVGKTFVAAALARAWRLAGLRVGVMKPLATGARWREGELVSDDTVALLNALAPGANPAEVTPFAYEAPLAPSVAARLEGRPLRLGLIVDECRRALDRWRTSADLVVVEGVGGFLCPIADDGTFADLAVALHYPVLVVARAGLGTLNHTLLTVEAIKRRGLRVAGVVLNHAGADQDPAAPTNPAELARLLRDAGPLISVYHSASYDSAASALAEITPDLLLHDHAFRVAHPSRTHQAPGPSPMSTCPRCGVVFSNTPHDCPDSPPAANPPAVDAPSPDVHAALPDTAEASVLTAEPQPHIASLDSSSSHDAVSPLASGGLEDDLSDMYASGSALPNPRLHAPSSWPASLVTGLDTAPTAAMESGALEDYSAHGSADARATFRAWSMLAMTAYASAVTFMLAWLVFSGRVRWGPPATGARTPSAGPLTSASSALPAPLPHAQTTGLGEPLRVADLEITPLDIRADSAWLRNVTSNEPTYRRGGSGCLWLRLRIRNRSESNTFAPLEAPFLRPTDEAESDAQITTDTGVIPMFPLAQTSEWVIEGEEFPSIGPGEERDYVVVSAPGAARELGRASVWRLRLRVAPDQTKLIGVRFSKTDVQD